MITVFLSRPIEKGDFSESMKIKVKNYLKNILKEEVKFFEQYESNLEHIWILSQALPFLKKADLVVFTHDWEGSQICRIERRSAKNMGIHTSCFRLSKRKLGLDSSGPFILRILYNFLYERGLNTMVKVFICQEGQQYNPPINNDAAKSYLESILPGLDFEIADFDSIDKSTFYNDAKYQEELDLLRFISVLTEMSKSNLIIFPSNWDQSPLGISTMTACKQFKIPYMVV